MTRIFIALAFWWTLCNNASIVGEAGGIVSSWQINYAVIDTNHAAYGKHHCVDFARLATRALELAQGARAEAHA